MALALIVPGLGHFYLGRRRRAVVFFLVVLFMFLTGIWLKGRLYTPEPGGLLSLLATVGSMGIGLLYFLALKVGPAGDITSITFEYGTAFMLTAGLMNLLLVLDSFDISENGKA
jgi:uncharacterized membrane protein